MKRAVVVIRAGDCLGGGVTREDDVAIEGSLVTILFTDRAGRDASAERQGDDAASQARRAHLALLRAALAEHDGREVRLSGEGLMAVFTSAVAAVGCAIDMQRAVSKAAGERSLRVGLAAGETSVDGNDVHGAPVIIASRLCDTAAAGQILAADVLRRVAGGRVAALMAPAQTLRLRDVDERVATVEICWRENQNPAPPPATGSREITVVVVDDERLLRAGFRVILDAEPDIRVIGEAPDGRVALDVVRRRRPDVVLMDIRMPELDGLAAAAQIIADPELHSAVVMLTTFDASPYV